jgi:hypothetical protein
LGRLLTAAVAVATIAGGSATPADAQPSDGSGDVPGSYQYLSNDAQNLVNTLLDEHGMPQGAPGYDSLTESQRATFEAIVHALYAQGIFAIVEEVTQIWGKDPTSDDGRDQFRVSVVLVEGAVEFLLAHREYRKSEFFGIGLGHVKLPNGDVVGDGGADSVRQVAERRPELQISWLEADYTIGEIDIDYREGNSHTETANSDVRASVGGELHLDLHRERYRRPPDIDAWWRR